MDEAKNIWSSVLSEIKKELSEEEFYIWFENLDFLESNGGEIKISTPNSFHKNQVEKRFAKKIQDTLISKNYNEINIVFTNENSSLKSNTKPEDYMDQTKIFKEDKFSNKRIDPKNPIKNMSEYTAKYTTKEEHTTTYKNPYLKKKYTFENFITGQNNKLAYKASIAIAKNPGKKYNPCLIYGGVGLGKTHLLQSIGNKAEELQSKEFKILYVTAENFLNEFVESIKTNETKKFKKKYRYLDMLLIDDVHDLQNKEGIQEELFHTFNALYEDNKQIVFTCDRSPSELINFTDRLKSRFTRGLNVDISKPNFELRMAIIEKKATEDGIKVPKDILNLMAEKVTTNIRDLEAAVTKLKAYIDLDDIEIDEKIVEKIITEIIIYENEKIADSKYMDVENIKKIILKELKIPSKDIEGNSKKPEITKARHLYAYLLRKFTELSTTEIGKIMGGKTHSTVLYSINKINKEINNDVEINNLIKVLMNKISKN